MNNAVAVKRLHDLLSVDSGVGELPVSRLQIDSRAVVHGDLFIALPGYRVDGREFILKAISSGANAVLAESDGYSEARQLDFPNNVIWVNGLKRILGGIAHRFFEEPSARLRVIAVTGTNGKTTVSHLLAGILNLIGIPAGALGTLGYGHPDSLIPLENTTPDVISVHRILQELLLGGCQVVAMEASSHGLDQGRLDNVLISTAILTNITRDHLDYHQTMDAYCEAKARLVGWRSLRNLVVNQDDTLVMKIADAVPAGVKVVHYSLRKDSTAEVKLLECNYRSDGMCLTLSVGGEIFAANSLLMGEFNVANILAATAALWVEGFDIPRILDSFKQVKPVTGRMERLACDIKNAPVVVVDYAHTPDALSQVLSALRKHCSGKLWCVFGCGGNRDKGKRPIMGAVAARLADHVIITTDNPRFESPSLIIDEICADLADAKNVTIIEHRAQAIQFAIASAKPGDVVLLAGKGHERYQEVGDQRLFFSDHQTAMAAIENLVFVAGKPE